MSLHYDDTPTKAHCVSCSGQLRFGRFFYHWAPAVHACSRSCLRRWLRHVHRKEAQA